MKASLENFKVTAIISVFVGSIAFVARHVIDYTALQNCTEEEGQLPCGYRVAAVVVELLAGAICTGLSMFACCHDTRCIGATGFVVALLPAALRFLLFLRCTFEESPSQLLSLQTSSLGFWLALAIAFFALHVSPSIFSLELKPVKRGGVARITEVFQEEDAPPQSERGAGGAQSQRELMSSSPSKSLSSGGSPPSRLYLKTSSTLGRRKSGALGRWEAGAGGVAADEI